MPYSPVPEALRRRSRQACHACRSSKKRCDAKDPCTNCVRRGLAPTCMYSNLRTRPPTPPPSSSTPESSAQKRPEDVAESRAPSAAAVQDSGVASSSREGSPPLAQDPRMLLSAKGENIYVGASASISFLQFLRQLLRRYAGPSAFTESQKRHTMLEAAMPPQVSTEFAGHLDHPAKVSLIETFYQATSGFLHIFSQQDALRLIEAQTFGGLVNDASFPFDEDDQVTMVNLMIAIGARCRWKDEADIGYSATCFLEAQHQAFENKLQDVSLAMVINFVLMAFYMCCACRRNTAMTYLGIALSSATGLGLHKAHLDRSLAPKTRELRARTLKSLLVLDLYCNAMLGRPSAPLGLLYEPKEEDQSKHAASHHMRALNANFQLCFIIETISLQLSHSKSIKLDTAEDFLQQLRDWARDLPEGLRLTLSRDPTPGLSDATHREMSIGNVHIACSYYFGVILATRGFLISSMMRRIRQQRRRGATGDPKSRPEEDVDSKTDELASVCSKSAVYMVQMCHEAGSWDLLLGNMCLLQAWVFAASLILGFCRLHQDELWPQEVYGASVMACGVLEKLSKASPQAQRYHEILLQFLCAVESYQDSVSEKQTDGESKYLERILRPRPGGVPRRSGDSTPAIQPAIPPVEDSADDSLNTTSFEEILWRQSSALMPQTTDDLGFQMLLEELSPNMFFQDETGQPSGELFPWVPWDDSQM